MRTKLKLSNGSSRYGAQMGRRNVIPDNLPLPPDKPLKMRLERLRWVDGAYDQFGAYWGMGTHVWCAWYAGARCDRVEVFVRAVSRSEAIGKVRGIMQTEGARAEFFTGRVPA